MGSAWSQWTWAAVAAIVLARARTIARSRRASRWRARSPRPLPRSASASPCIGMSGPALLATSATISTPASALPKAQRGEGTWTSAATVGASPEPATAGAAPAPALPRAAPGPPRLSSSWPDPPPGEGASAGSPARALRQASRTAVYTATAPRLSTTDRASALSSTSAAVSAATPAAAASAIAPHGMPSAPWSAPAAVTVPAVFAMRPARRKRIRSPPTRMACDSWACAPEAPSVCGTAARACRNGGAVVGRGWYVMASESMAARNLRFAPTFTHAGCYFAAK
jgi:hypothetical protein